MRVDMAKPNEELSGQIVRSSGNVFADLGFADAGERQTKVRLAIAINDVLKRRGLSQRKAAELLGINQPKVSALSMYRLEGFSVERLMRFLHCSPRTLKLLSETGFGLVARGGCLSRRLKSPRRGVGRVEKAPHV